jgi:hypothetical protein
MSEARCHLLAFAPDSESAILFQRTIDEDEQYHVLGETDVGSCGSMYMRL